MFHPRVFYGALVVQGFVVLLANSAEPLCGPQNINLTDQYLLSVSVPGNHSSVQCLWLVTSPSNTTIFVDLLNVNVHYRQRFVFGQGHNSENESTVFGEINNGNERLQNGSSFFSTGTYLWITFTSSFHDDKNNVPTQQLLLRFENHTGEVQCKLDQFLCQQDSKCIPLRAFCDGEFHCSNYIDEAGSCRHCGTSEINLQFSEATTIRGEFEVDFSSQLMCGNLAIYSGGYEAVPNTTSSHDVIVRNYTEGMSTLKCVWRLTEPEGTRIKVTVAEFSGSGNIMRMGNGRNPTATPARVINSRFETRIPTDILSIDSGVWITWEKTFEYRFGWSLLQYLGFIQNVKLRLVISTYNVTKCEEGQFSCPSGLECLDNLSHVCDGQRECTAYGDELNCGVCGKQELRCGMTDACVPRHQICDGNADCRDYSDERMCGFCGNETVHLGLNETYTIRHDDHHTVCTWVIIAKPGWRIEARIQKLDNAHEVTIETSNNATNPVSQAVLREVRTKSHFAYPRSITTNSSIMWIKAKGRYADLLQIDFRQYRNVECSSGEHMCSSGLKCIPEEARCNGIPECPEFWDEISCGNCSKEEFACLLGDDCVPRDRVCDGRNDCPDLSDEMECGPCGKSFYNLSHGEFDILTSPGWPMSYHTSTQCLWLLEAEVGYRVVLYFEEFSLKQSYDFLYCGDGEDFESVFLTASGNRFPLKVASMENKMFVRFTSSKNLYTTDARRFKLRVDKELAEAVSCGEGQITCKVENLICVRNDTSERGRQFCSQDECGRRVLYISDKSTDLYSPSYPQAYPPDVACHWEVISRKGVLVSIIKFATETSRDILRLEGTMPHGGGTVSFKVDGSTKVRFIAFNSSVQIMFDTDSTVEYSGFHLRLYRDLSAHDNISYQFDCGDGSYVSRDGVCDGFKDCQTYGSDETHCNITACPDFYHCTESSECLNWPLVCDGTPDCPLGDDETDSVCGQRCPNGCQCDVDEGIVQVKCKDGWNRSSLANLVKRTEYLEISGGNASCLQRGIFKEFTHLKSLQLNNNKIYSVIPGTFYGLTNLTFLDISNNSITRIDANSFFELQSLKILKAMEISLEAIEEKAFDGLNILQFLVLIRRSSSSQSTIFVKDGALTDLVRLEKVFVDDHRLCCEFMSSIGFDVSNCFTTERQPPLNLCGSLMRNNFLRVSMWILGLSALVGNAAVLVWRCCYGKGKGGKKTHSFLVLNLAVSDFMMGVYMLVIAAADVYFGEKYYREAKEWRSSPICKIAGVISVLSSEASVFFVTLISLDTFSSIVFPFSLIRLGEKSATITACTIWLASLSLSVGPTVFANSDSKVYGLSDVCIGLPLLTKPTSYDLEDNNIDTRVGTDTIKVPVGRGKEPAWIYSIILFLGVNLLCFLVVLFCYISIFVNVKRTSSRVRRMTHRDQEIKTAVKMALIVGTDFACWMPVIIMGILSQTGVVDISLDMYAWTVVFILPINSSLNPYMYTFYTALTNRRDYQGALFKQTRFATEMNIKTSGTIHSGN